MKQPPFHLSIGVPSLDESVDFFVNVLGAVVQRRDPSGYVNLDVPGCRITLKQSAEEFHYGINVDGERFDEIWKEAAQSGSVVTPPTVVDAGTPMERRKMYLRSPAGHLIEIKSYPAAAFETKP